jgi:NAD(P)H-dependent flavin oxidoreductase YrpB (nitropropane dioxygenase family)
MPIIETALTRLLGIEHPILLAPMGSAAGGRLAAAVTNAGGLGMIGSGYAIRRTFRSTPEGKIGMLHDRALIVVSAHGGYCGDIPPGQPDFLTPYLRAIFATIGISLVEFLRLEAVAQALDRANTWIEQRLPGLLR